MAKSRALYRDDVMVTPRARIAIDAAALGIHLPGGGSRAIGLDGASVTILDAERVRRFVRMLVIERGHDRAHLITVPERGAIAPRAVPVPRAPDDAIVLDDADWDVLAHWLAGGGRLAGLTVGELARLAALATPHFAIVIGEVAAIAALDQVWEEAGPLRGGIEVEAALAPLRRAARDSPRAAEALVAALALAAAG
ncbi:MAG: hypothetical protein K8W52_27030, partial [Deltaproteobacteria bacterium]|nr:hypothetical protein [Deltaproteobacteria bacterium]